MSQYTLVQHSAVLSGHSEFSQAVETAGGVTEAQARQIIADGGVVFDDYIAAEDAADRENYQPGNAGLIPRVPGTFAKRTVGGLKLYVPVAP